MDQAAAAEQNGWIPIGIAAGVVGAAVIAVFFLAVDLVAGRPFWTPGALGSALFLGDPLPAGATPQPAIVTGYTVLHGGVFVSVGLIVSYALLGSPRRLGLASGVAAAVALFAGIELIFLVFAGLLAPDVAGELTSGKITAANLLAATAMSATLGWSPSGRRAPRLHGARRGLTSDSRPVPRS